MQYLSKQLEARLMEGRVSVATQLLGDMDMARRDAGVIQKEPLPWA